MRAWPIGEALPDGRLFAAAADRNRAPILEVIGRELPPSGLVLEIASGTGQHVTHFTRSLPHLFWQPSDPDSAYRRSIALWTAFERLANVNQPIVLDVRKQPWPIATADAIICINMVHVAPWATARALFEGAQQVLPQDGLLYLYGPFRRGGAHTSVSNARFDADLRAHDPQWGLRDVEALAALGNEAGFALAETVAMPANNLSLVFRKRNVAAE